MLNFDFFRKLNIDRETTTSAGGLFSIVAALCGLLLFCNEYGEFRKFEVKHEMFIDHNIDQDFRVNMNVTFIRAPCHVISIDSEDEMGTRHPGTH